MNRDDEISSLLRQFRKRPIFADNSIVSPGHLMKQKRKHSYDGEFSRVKYNASREIIIFNYVHLEHSCSSSVNSTCHICVCLEFEMSVSTKLVSCTYCSTPIKSISETIKEKVDEICRDKLSESIEGNDSTTTLFSIASRLLQQLNDAIPTIFHSNTDNAKAKGETFCGLVKRLSRITNSPIRNPQMYHMLNLQTLLLRCAAAGRTRSHILSPIPREFSEGRDEDDLARLVFSLTDEMYIYGFRGEQTQQQTQQTPEVWTLLSYLLSLPLAISRLTKETNNAPKEYNLATSSKSIVGKLTLDLSTSLGDPAPSFRKLAKKYGTITAYHGTKIETAWSILNYGLQNLSYNKTLSQNGAIMGDGVYLSSSRQVAEGFAIMATERQPRSLAYAFQHESLLHLLSYVHADVAKLDALDTYVIKCLPVFEATIIKPPMGDKEFDERITRQEGKYFVCEESEFVRVVKLHLTFELTKKLDVWQWLTKVPLSLLVLLVALAWVFH